MYHQSPAQLIKINRIDWKLENNRDLWLMIGRFNLMTEMVVAIANSLG